MIANYHTHTFRCHHAQGQDEEYVQQAIDGGLKILGFSDHTPYLFTDGYIGASRMLPEELPGYCESVRSLAKKHAGQLQIHLGVEAEFYSKYWADTLKLLQDNGIEYMILGQHFLNNEAGYKYVNRPNGSKDELRQYVYETCQAMDTGVFTYLAHPDVFNFTGDEGFFLVQLRQICKVAKSCGLPLEYNLLGIRSHRSYPNRRFWEMAAEEGCQVILGTDAHKPQDTVDPASEKQALEVLSTLGIEVLPTIELKKIY